MGSITRKVFIAVMLIASCVSVNAGDWEMDAAGGFSKIIRYVPEAVSPIGEGRSLLILLHGCAQSIEHYRNANLEKVAEDYGMVVAVPDATSKQGFACWGFWTGMESRTVGDYKNIINLAKDYIQEIKLDIDPNQIYIAGLSSGGAFAMQTWCLAPDIFSGVAAVGAPEIDYKPVHSFGESEAQDQGIYPRDPRRTAEYCKRLAGSYIDHFYMQKASIAHGTADYMVQQESSIHNAKALALVLGAEKSEAIALIDDMAEETLWVDKSGSAAVSLLGLHGVSHAWPGGEGASGTYIDGSNINYGEYVAKFFNANINYPMCKFEINGFQFENHYALKKWERFNVEGDVVVEGECELQSVSLELDDEFREDLWRFVDEDFMIEPGDHELKLKLSAIRSDGAVINKELTWSFSSEIAIPAWCSYFPEKYWKWLPSCADGLK